MRKITGLFVAIIFIGVTVTFAQEDKPYVRDQSSIRFGLKAGLNITGAYHAIGDEFIVTARPAFTTGVFLNFPTGRCIGVQPEVLYARRSIRASGNILNAPYDFTRTTTRIDVPILLTIKAVDILSLVAGPQFTHLIKQKDVFTQDTGPAQRDEFRKDHVRKNIIGITAGAHFNIDPILLDARIGWDFKNNTHASVQTTPRYSYIWYQFTVGIALKQ